MQKPIFRQAALERLSSPEQLDQLMQVTTPKGWLALIALAGLLVTAVILGFVGSIPVTVTGQCILLDGGGANNSPTNDLEAIIYVSPMDGRDIRPGMDVQILPSTVKEEEAGYMLGVVASVDERLSTAQDMLRTLGSDELVQVLAAGKIMPIAVHADLLESGAGSGYKWTLPGSAARYGKIQSGTLCSADIVTARKRPIDLVLPIGK
jgi:HlyD family secretion protein